MTTQHRHGSARKKVAAAVGVGALVAAMAGTGALNTLYTSITGNQFRAAVPAETDTAEGALLEITGTPIDKTFNTGQYNDQAQATWTLTNHGPDATEFDGTFEVTNPVSDELAAALSVEYGVTNAAGDITRWRPAGTLDAPRTFADVLGISEIEGESELAIPVRLVLADPSDLVDAGDEGDVLRVTADFVVSDLDPLLQAQP
jgi:hypothetical protein